MDNRTQTKQCKKKCELERLHSSQLRLRRIVGVLGIGLPFVLAIASFVCADATTVKDSISAYYHSEMRNIFVGILCVIGMFLFSYKGYDAWDDRVSYLAGLSAIGVALFPVNVKDTQNTINAMHNNNDAINAMHFLSAIVLFLTLAYFSWYRFTKSKCKSIPKGTPKAKRNMVYKRCAYVMILSLLAIAVWKLTYRDSSFPFVFWSETVMLMAFGVSWFVKGDTLLRDDEEKARPIDRNGSDDENNSEKE